MIRDPYKKFTRSMRVEEHCDSDALDPNPGICEIQTSSHHISTCNSRHQSQSIIAMARFVEFDVNRMDKANANLYRQAIEIKKLRLKCDSSLETCKCLVMIDTDVTTVIACAFYQLTTLVFIEVICVKTLHQGHGQAIMKHIISTYQTLRIHLISLDCVIKFTTR